MSPLTPVTFLRKKQLTYDTFAFFFEKEFTDFLPGQFTTLFLGRTSRDFTIASTAFDKEITIVTKKGKSDYKKRLFELKPGQNVQMTQPAGGFTLREDAKSPQVFLAGGIGITVFYSMIRYVVEKQLQIPLTLLVSFSKKDNIIFYDELKEIEKQHKNIQVIYTLSQDQWDHEKGRISEALIKKYIMNFKNVDYMIAGGEQMVYDTEELLQKMGVDQEKIRIDIFTGY